MWSAEGMRSHGAPKQSPERMQRSPEVSKVGETGGLEQTCVSFTREMQMRAWRSDFLFLPRVQTKMLCLELLNVGHRVYTTLMGLYKHTYRICGVWGCYPNIFP